MIRNPPKSESRGATAGHATGQVTDEEFKATGPHRIFLWNRKGVYIQCAFPHPPQGQFFGGDQVIGKKISEVLPPEPSKLLQGEIQYALNLQEKRTVRFQISTDLAHCQIEVQLYPMGRHVLGLITIVPFEGAEPGLQILATDGRRSLGHLNVWQLTNREWEVIEAFEWGLSNRHIALKLGISERTVKYHIHNILKKLGFSSRLQLSHQRLYEVRQFLLTDPSL